MFGGSLDDILCEQFERTVNKDNTVSLECRTLQIPSDEYRNHYVKTRDAISRPKVREMKQPQTGQVYLLLTLFRASLKK